MDEMDFEEPPVLKEGGLVDAKKAPWLKEVSAQKAAPEN